MTDILYLISESPSWTSVETHTGVYKPSPALTIPGFSLGSGGLPGSDASSEQGSVFQKLRQYKPQTATHEKSLGRPWEAEVCPHRCHLLLMGQGVPTQDKLSLGFRCHIN